MERCWSRSSGIDIIYRDFNEEEAKTETNFDGNFAPSPPRLSFSRQGNEATSKDANFGHFPIFKLERQGYGYSFKHVKFGQSLTFKLERHGDDGSSKHVKSGQSLISNSASEVRLPIQCGDVAKPEHFKLWRGERCWSSSSGGDTISSMLSINRDKGVY